LLEGQRLDGGGQAELVPKVFRTGFGERVVGGGPRIALLRVPLVGKRPADLVDVDVEAGQLGMGARLIVGNDEDSVLEERLENLPAHASGHPHEKRTAITAESRQTFSNRRSAVGSKSEPGLSWPTKTAESMAACHWPGEQKTESSFSGMISCAIS
jgi:hypothetical protein